MFSDCRITMARHTGDSLVCWTSGLVLLYEKYGGGTDEYMSSSLKAICFGGTFGPSVNKVSPRPSALVDKVRNLQDKLCGTCNREDFERRIYDWEIHSEHSERFMVIAALS